MISNQTLIKSLLLLQAMFILGSLNLVHGQIISDDVYTLFITSDTCVNLDVLTNDSLGAVPIFTIATPPATGTATITLLNEIEYCTSLGGALITYADTFYYSICDTTPVFPCDTGMVIVNVLPDTSCSMSTSFIFAGTGGGSINLAATVTGGSPPYTYVWDMGDGTIFTTTSPTHTFLLDGVYDVCLTTTNVTGCTATYCDSIWGGPSAVDSVWPGDADDNLTANNFDVLALGLAYGHSATARPIMGNLWEPYFSFDWPDSIPGGINEKHQDCNGDGIVNHDDTLAIVENYGETHSKTSPSGTPNTLTMNPPLYLAIDGGSVSDGDTLTVGIYLGDAVQPVNDIYGLAFSVSYDPALVDSTAPVRVDFTGGWLPVNSGGSTSNFISISKDFRSSGAVDIGISRINHTSANGQGRIGGVAIVIVENIGGKRAGEISMPLEIFNVKAINLQGEIIDLDLHGDTATILSRGAPVPEPEGFNVFPSPFKDQLHLEFGDAQVSSIRIIEVTGKVIQLISKDAIYNKQSLKIETSQFSNGIYFLEIETDKGTITRKILKL